MTEGNGPDTKIGRMEGRLISLERQVGEIHADVKSLLKRDAEREGAEKEKKRVGQTLGRGASIIAGILGGAVTLVAQAAAQKLGLMK